MRIKDILEAQFGLLGFFDVCCAMLFGVTYYCLLHSQVDDLKQIDQDHINKGLE